MRSTKAIILALAAASPSSTRAFSTRTSFIATSAIRGLTTISKNNVSEIANLCYFCHEKLQLPFDSWDIYMYSVALYRKLYYVNTVKGINQTKALPWCQEAIGYFYSLCKPDQEFVLRLIAYFLVESRIFI